MKKIYLSLLGLVAIGSVHAQSVFSTKPSSNHRIADPHAKFKTTNNLVKKTSGGPGHISGSVYPANVIAAYNLVSGTDYDVFANAIFMDSTATTSDNTGLSNIYNIKAGALFDPKGLQWDPANPFVQLLSSSDSYTIDSLWFGVGYKQVPGKYSVVDTLIVEMAWGLPSTTTVFQALSISSTTPAMQFRTPKNNSSTSHGNMSFFTAPASNYKMFKVALTSADTIDGVNYTNNFGYVIAPNVNQTIPAGNIVAVAYTYKPGSTVAAGSVIHQYSGGAAQTENGIVGYLYSDPSTSSNYKFYDNSSYSTSLDYITKQRYGLFSGGQAFLNSCTLPNTEGGWDIGFSVSYTSTVGMLELDKKGFVLGQNIPNPFSSSSEVSYMLSKDASSATFTISDVTGRVISTENVDKSEGTHSVKIKALNAGIYYYTLNIDGKLTTRKMIAQ